MGSEGLGVGATPYRRPWLWLPALGIAAVIATALLVANARSRLAQNDQQFESAQRVRLSEVAIRIDDYFAKATQLVATGAAEFGPLHDDTATAQRLVSELYRSRRSSQIYDLGPSFEPGAFNGDRRLFCVFAYAGRNGGMQIYYRSPRSPDYTREHWYRRAMEAGPNQTVFDGPYTSEGVSYISTMLAFDRDGKPAGVMTVDMLTTTFKQQDLMPGLQPGDIAWVESSRRGRNLVGTAPLPHDGDRIDHYVPLRYTGAFVHISTDAAPLRAADRRIVTGTIALALAVWSIAAVLAFTLAQVWKARERTGTLEIEVAVGKQIESELRKAARTDALTALPNRAAFLERAAEIMATGDEQTFAVYFIDLDRFNVVNDTLGHLAGDELLRMIASRMRAHLDPDVWVGRLGGDEFVVIAPVGAAEAVAMAERIGASLREPVLLSGRLVYTSASIGVVVADGSYKRPEELLRDSDIAMYEAKRLGRARFAVFDAAMRNHVAEQSDLENALRRGIRRKELLPFYQPIVDVRTLQPVSFEALARWERPGIGTVNASDFIPQAERCGLIDAIDESILQNVCEDAATLFDRFPNASVSVNVSAAHVTAPGLAESIEGILRTHSVAPQRLKLEITETAIMGDAELALATLEALRQKGLRIVVDDFGAGHSSLAYLHRLPITGLKIDRSFIAPLETDPHAQAIVRSIVALAQSLELDTVAEGVENEAQLELVRGLGVMHAQGFFFSPAVPLHAILSGALRSSLA